MALHLLKRLVLLLTILFVVDLIAGSAPVSADSPDRAIPSPAELRTHLEKIEASLFQGAPPPDVTLELPDVATRSRPQPKFDPGHLPERNRFPAVPSRGEPVVPLHRLGVPDETGRTPRASSDLNDPFNPINAYAPYSFISGASAVDVGLAYGGGGLVNGWQTAADICPACYVGPSYFSDYTSQVLQTAMWQSAQQTGNYYHINLLNSLRADANQFWGQQNYLGGWSTAFSQPWYTGAGLSSFGISPDTLAVAGYNQSSPYNFTTQFLMNMNRLNAPWDLNQFAGFSGVFRQRQADATAQAGLEAQYEQLGDQQLALYYTDSGLYDLRSESSAVLIALLYDDPLYLYWSYALDATLAWIYTNHSATYPTMIATAQQIASWTTDPANAQEAANREYTRRLYRYYRAVVDYEMQLFLYYNPSYKTWIQETSAFVEERRQMAWKNQNAGNWYADWRGRWASRYESNNQYDDLLDSTTRLTEISPALETYLRLNNEVIDLFPQFQDHPAVQEVAQMSINLAADQQTADQINSAYQTYANDLQSILNNTTFLQEQERHLAATNRIAVNDPLYDDMTNTEFAVILLLYDLQEQVYLAVDECYQLYGNNCNPYNYQPVNDLLGSQDTVDLIVAAGLFYALKDTFWYQFYTSRGDYPALETQTLAHINQTLATVAPQIETARARFRASVNDLPAVNQLRAAQSALVDVVRGRNTARAATLPAAKAEADYPYQELNQRLNRMTVLAQSIEGCSEARGTCLYLPMLSR